MGISPPSSNMSLAITSSEVTRHAPIEYDQEVNCGTSEPPLQLPEQHPLSVTLDGGQLALAAGLLIGLIYFGGSVAAVFVLGSVPLMLWVYNDFLNYLALGPGGTPSTFNGYLKISWLRLWTVRDPYTAREPDPKQVPSKGILARDPLPYRMGPKPQVVGIAPHRQINQPGSVHCNAALRRTLEKLALKNPDSFGTECSYIEKHGLALFARHPLSTTTCQGEVCHVHDRDFSMHMSLHPEDAREVLQKGWGQRHPLGWKWWVLKTPVTADFIMVYAPRDESELRMVCRIIEGAIWYATAEETEVAVYLKSS